MQAGTTLFGKMSTENSAKNVLERLWVGALVVGNKTYQVKVAQLCTEIFCSMARTNTFKFPIAPSAVVTAPFFPSTNKFSHTLNFRLNPF